MPIWLDMAILTTSVQLSLVDIALGVVPFNSRARESCLNLQPLLDQHRATLDKKLGQHNAGCTNWPEFSDISRPAEYKG